MRAVVQRVSTANVRVNEEMVSIINKGLLVLLGVGHDDTDKDMEYLCDKIVNLRIFEDKNDKMNLSLLDVKGELLVVSQFTLFGDLKKGKRPNFMNAAPAQIANEMYLKFVEKCRTYDINVKTGVFGEHMDVSLINDGPVTIIIDSKKDF
ncbi:D-tyrosyl-tRNA(Tyr) deacylase [Proteiniborus ethanoligenes]|uniref:D-aminoacyl-tRNA deacylase n=1 Tax=Proteiniborus ethanoligenes TaxID=415015 RepID=A0A1H3QS08_9FIRM|nr:D-aminoacyl-tRNA deacylase [Proteiniborus ethanoligenes]TAH63218.1 MAG: D-tyrosyl-tRNA(Tyr) deacylase [Gottschalkiaceae bacterium]SDZ16197.1 D-tyrosyl-tRNA(Tyr) deacylase [Proteiniborus ethanoligenes]